MSPSASYSSKSSLLYPMSLKDITSSILDKEQQEECYRMKHLLESERFCYNGCLLVSSIVTHLLMLKTQPYLQKQFNYDDLNTDVQLEIMLSSKHNKNMDLLFKIYFYKVKVTPYREENSGLVCGKLINQVLHHHKILPFLNLTPKLDMYIDQLNKLIVQSFEWHSSQTNLRLQNLILTN